MKKIIAFSLFSAFCLAHNPPPFSVERYQIDQIYKAVGEPALRAEAVALLTAIAVGDNVSALPRQSLKTAGISLQVMTS